MQSTLRKGLQSLCFVVLLSGCLEDSRSRLQDVDPYLNMNSLLVEHGCSNCHASTYIRVGPSMLDVAQVYGASPEESRQVLAESIANGSRGRWGEAIMPKQWQITSQEADQLAAVILALEADDGVEE